MTFNDTTIFESAAETEEREAVQAGRTFDLLHDSDYTYGVHEDSDEAHRLDAQWAGTEAAFGVTHDDLHRLFYTNPWDRTD